RLERHEARRHLFGDRDRVLRRDLPVARIRVLGPAHRAAADQRLRPRHRPCLPGLGVRHLDSVGDAAGPLPLGSRPGSNLAFRRPRMNLQFNPPAILSLIFTVLALVAFLLMLQETLAIVTGRDPLTNGVRAVARRVPRLTYALAVVIGMLLGHLLWP